MAGTQLFWKSDFRGANLSMSDFSHATLDQCNFEKSNVRLCRFHNVTQIKSDLKKAKGTRLFKTDKLMKKAQKKAIEQEVLQ